MNSGAAFGEVDKLVVTDIYPASEQPIPGSLAKRFVKLFGKRANRMSNSIPDKTWARFSIGNQLVPGDLLISLGAGDIHEVTTSLAKDLEQLAAISEALDEEDATLRLYER